MRSRGCYARNVKTYLVTRAYVVVDCVRVTAANAEIAKDVAAESPRPECVAAIPVRFNQQKWRAKRLPA